MSSFKRLWFASLITIVLGQTYTLSDCHRHGSVEYCVLPDGSETPWTTYSSSQAAEPTATSTSAAATDEHSDDAAPSEATSCHLHGSTQFCFVGEEEYEVITSIDTSSAPDHYDDCHSHGEELHCTGDGIDVTLAPFGSETESSGHAVEGHEDGEEESALTADGVSCHFHAGVEHCVDAEGNTVETGCSRPENDYNVPLRIGLLFVILVTSCIGVFIPIFTERFSSMRTDNTIFIGLRQFGTGIIISTALVHLFTHAGIYFSNECLGGLEYEATTAAIVTAGLFVTFLVELVAHRVFVVKSQSRDESSNDSPARAGSKTLEIERAAMVDDGGKAIIVNTAVIEAGIIFHSVLLGIVLVVAGDSSFITLFVVILFHQMFEGIALGTRIAIMPGGLLRKLILGLAFAITTPIGMAIGIGALSSFNGNDPATIIAIGTLNAFSAGILLWIGVTEMWFKEWWYGPLAQAGLLKTLVGFFGLVLGLVVMSLIGKWA